MEVDHSDTIMRCMCGGMAGSVCGSRIKWIKGIIGCARVMDYVHPDKGHVQKETANLSKTIWTHCCSYLQNYRVRL